MSIADELIRLRHAFAAEGLDPPVMITLKNAEQGNRFQSAVLQATSACDYTPETVGYTHTVETIDGDHFEMLQVEAAGIKVRWPIARLTLHGRQYR